MVFFSIEAIYPIIGFFGAALGGVFVWRTGSNRAWKDAAEGWKAEAELRGQEVARCHENETRLRSNIASLSETVSKLEALPRLESLISLMSETSARQERHAKQMMELAVSSLSHQIEECDKRSQERHLMLVELYRKSLNGG